MKLVYHCSISVIVVAMVMVNVLRKRAVGVGGREIVCPSTSSYRMNYIHVQDLVILVERVLDGMMIAMLLSLLDEPGAGSSVAVVYGLMKPFQ